MKEFIKKNKIAVVLALLFGLLLLASAISFLIYANKPFRDNKKGCTNFIATLYSDENFDDKLVESCQISTNLLKKVVGKSDYNNYVKCLEDMTVIKDYDKCNNFIVGEMDDTFTPKDSK